jgi:glycosyltransferase involved in cell wall biosynthesis
MQARKIGGGLGVPELERLWEFARRRSYALCLGGASEVRQIEAVLRAKGATRVVQCESVAEARNFSGELDRFDNVVIALHPELADTVADWRDAIVDKSRLLVLHDALPRPPRRSRCAAASDTHHAAAHTRNKAISRKLHGGGLNVVFLNDVGFQYGAGAAMRRQAASFMLNGWRVSMVAWWPGDVPTPPSIARFEARDGWREILDLRDTHADRKLSEDDIVAAVASKIATLAPDAIIVENIHGAGWPPALLMAVRRIAPTVAYMHDCYWVTGRCAHAGPCELYKTGCNATCPTAHMYPRLAPEKIGPAWALRADIFTGPDAIPLIANSSWTRDFARRRFGDRARTEVVHLGLDHELFAPIPKTTARKLLGVPQDKTVILMGAVDMRDPYKGGPLFKELHRALSARDDVAVILFGLASEQLTSARSFGLVRDEGLMPFIYSCADIFVSTSTAESFGQTLLEASACGVPVVALSVGGVKDAVVDGETGLLVDTHDANSLLASVDRLIADPAMRERLGRAGRARVEQHFTLEHQADAWIDCLERLC